MIQVLTYSESSEEFKGPNVTINSIHNARSLDDFAINVIDLKDSNIWKNNNYDVTSINEISDFDSLATMIRISKKNIYSNYIATKLGFLF